MHSFAQALASPEAQAAPQAFQSLELATNVQMELAKEQQNLAITMQDASTALGTSIRQSERDQAQNQENSAIGSIVSGGLGTLAGAGSLIMSTKGMYGLRDDEASLENTQKWNQKLTDIQQNPSAENLVVKNAGQANQKTSQQSAADLRAVDKTTANPDDFTDEMNITSRAHPDEYNTIVQNTKDKTKSLEDSVSEKRQKVTNMAQTLNTLGNSLGEVASGAANMTAADQTRAQADQDIIRNADQTATDSIKSASDSIAQGVQSLDSAKQSIVQTLLQGLSSANAA